MVVSDNRWQSVRLFVPDPSILFEEIAVPIKGTGGGFVVASVFAVFNGVGVLVGELVVLSGDVPVGACDPIPPATNMLQVAGPLAIAPGKPIVIRVEPPVNNAFESADIVVTYSVYP